MPVSGKAYMIFPVIRTKNNSPTLKRPVLPAALLALVGLFLLGLCLVYEYKETGRPSPTLDDTYIHLQFAKNLAAGEGLSFNPGEQVPGTTSPLWVALLTPLALFSKQVLVYWSIMLSAVSYLAAGLLAYVLSRKFELGQGPSFLAGALVLANGRMLWAGMSGMETDLFAALSMLGFILYLKDIKKNRMRAVTAIVFGLASLTRPEGYMLFAGVLVHFFIVLGNQKKKRSTEDPLSLPLLPVMIYLLMVLPYMVFSLLTIGHPLPTTFLAKQADMAAYRLSYIKFTALYFFLDNPPVALFFVLGAASGAWKIFSEKLDFLAGREALLVGWPVGYLAVSAALTPMPFHFCRYQIPVLPFMIIIAVLFGIWVIDKAGGRQFSEKGARFVRHAVYGLLIVGALAGHLGFQKGKPVLRWPEITATSADNIYSLHVRLGKWLKNSTPEDAVVATQDIGAMGYYSDRRIIDLVGLVTPEILPYVSGKGFTVERSRLVYQYLEKKRPDYLAIFPVLYPGLTGNQKVFLPIRIINIPNNQINAERRMVLFRCRWPKAEDNKKQ